MNAFEKNRFVAKHANVKHFDKDKALFIKVFPNSPIIPDLNRAASFSKKGLDERMLFELLNQVCGETIMENRGIIAKKEDPNANLDELAKAQAIVLNTEDIAAIGYHDKRGLVADLNIETPDQKDETLTSALISYKESMSDDQGEGTGEGDAEGDGEGNTPEGEGEGDNQGDDQGEPTDKAPTTEPTTEAPANEGGGEDIKKKEGPGPNTPE